MVSNGYRFNRGYKFMVEGHFYHKSWSFLVLQSMSWIQSEKSVIFWSVLVTFWGRDGQFLVTHSGCAHFTHFFCTNFTLFWGGQRGFIYQRGVKIGKISLHTFDTFVRTPKNTLFWPKFTPLDPDLRPKLTPIDHDLRPWFPMTEIPWKTTSPATPHPCTKVIYVST